MIFCFSVIGVERMGSVDALIRIFVKWKIAPDT